MTRITWQPLMFYLSIILYQVVMIHSGIVDDNDPDAMNDWSIELSKGKYFQSDNGSGGTTISTDFTTSPAPNTFTPGIYFKGCNDSSLVWLPGSDTCVAKDEVRQTAVETIRSSSNNSQEKADALISYFRSADNLTSTPDVADTLMPEEIDELIDNLGDIETRRFSNIGILSQPTTKGYVGFLSIYNSTKEEIINSERTRVNYSNLTAALVLSEQSIQQITAIKILIVDDPTVYRNFNPSTDQDLVSSIIIASVKPKSAVNVSLYFQVLNGTQPHKNGHYSCVFLDTNTSKWSESGCSPAVYNRLLKRYECTCNHLTTFTLIWSPDTPHSMAQRIASLVFLSISILSFIAVIIHALIIRFHHRIRYLKARDLLPLISSAATTALFIFFIALTMTGYTRTLASSSFSNPCFTSAHVLMFFVYFLLIFMFCVKSSVGYFNYLRFVHLFPEPSFRKLFLLLLLSFFISIAWTSFAAGFDSNTSFHITQLHNNTFCWFTRDMTYYFVTIPAGLFLVLNLTIIIFVAKRIIEHVRRATSPDQSYERKKQCVLVLLSSCVTQGIGWLFGPFITFTSKSAGNVLGWFFVIFIGLEGMWTILLYIVIQSQHMDEPKQISDKKERLKKCLPVPANVLEKRFRFIHRDARKEKHVFHDLYDEKTIDWKTSTYELK